MNNPSVTTVLQPFTDFSRIHPEVLAHAAERGKRIHGAAAAHLMGLWVPKLDDEAQPRFDNFRKWVDIMVDRVIWVEKDLICDCYGFHGHPDAALILKDGPGVVVPDWKSPVAESKTWRGQVSAYCHLVDQHGGLPDGLHVDRWGAVMLHPKGETAKFQEYTTRSTLYILQRFWEHYKLTNSLNSIWEVKRQDDGEARKPKGH